MGGLYCVAQQNLQIGDIILVNTWKIFQVVSANLTWREFLELSSIYQVRDWDNDWHSNCKLRWEPCLAEELHILYFFQTCLLLHPLSETCNLWYWKETFQKLCILLRQLYDHSQCIQIDLLLFFLKYLSHNDSQLLDVCRICNFVDLDSKQWSVRLTGNPLVNFSLYELLDILQNIILCSLRGVPCVSLTSV